MQTFRNFGKQKLVIGFGLSVGKTSSSSSENELARSRRCVNLVLCMVNNAVTRHNPSVTEVTMLLRVLSMAPAMSEVDFPAPCKKTSCQSNCNHFSMRCV